jgi:IPT/TIG domain
MRTRLLGLALLVFAAGRLAAATYTVTNTSDSGAGSLRQAITDANSNPGADTIVFNIPGSGVHTIVLTTWLPNATDVLTVDGYTQPGSSPNTLPLSQGTNAVLNVEINGGAITLAPCWSYQADGGRIQGVVINHCVQGAIYTIGSLTLTGNFLGTSPAGTPTNAGPMQEFGVMALGTLGSQPPITVIVGGPAPSDRNLISGNGDGVYLQYNVAGKVQGNLIGTDATVSYAITNGLGVFCTSPVGVQIGGPGANEGNVIGGSISDGFAGRFSVFQGNFVGTNPSETANLGNLGSGIAIDTSVVIPPTGILGGMGPGEGNVIAHNGGGGIFDDPAGLLMSGSAGRITARGNRFYDNRPVAIALGLDPPHPADPGDGDVGPNGSQNAPVITGIDYGPPTVAHAVLSSTPSMTFDVDFYANTSCVSFPVVDAEGEQLVGSVQATTDATGVVTIDFPLPSPLAPGQGVSALATDPLGNTSEFAQTILLTTSPRSGPAAGGGAVTISGQLLEAGATVAVGGLAPSNAVVTPPYTITANMPAFDPGTAHDVVVTNPGGVSGTLRNGYIADFLDVPPANQFHDDVVKLVASRVTAGVGGGLYGIGDSVKRQAMAVFVLKAEHGICYTPPPCTPGIFADVPCPSPFADWIEAMFAEGITGGCGGGNFCPLDVVRRDQMAPFLLKGVHGPTYVPPPCSGYFTDVPCPSLFADWIEQLFLENVTSGCGGMVYCPSNPNTRGQMATFLVKALRLP